MHFGESLLKILSFSSILGTSHGQQYTAGPASSNILPQPVPGPVWTPLSNPLLDALELYFHARGWPDTPRSSITDHSHLRVLCLSLGLVIRLLPPTSSHWPAAPTGIFLQWVVWDRAFRVVLTCWFWVILIHFGEWIQALDYQCGTAKYWI